MTQKPFEVATQVNMQLSVLLNNGVTDPLQYLAIVQNYAKLDFARKSGQSLDIQFSRNNRKYTIYATLSEYRYFFMFVEDLTMTVYRLYGGINFRTPELCQNIKARNGC